MKGIVILSLSLFLGIHCSSIAQTTVKLSKPLLELEANNINIYYNILNSSITDKFRIWIEITDSSGIRIEAKSLSGDYGGSVSGGENKMIIWDFIADNVYPDAGIYVQISAEILTTTRTDKSIKPGGAIIQSVIFPGLGLSRINKGKPHWLKGVAAYGCVAGSVIYNKKAASSYDSYLNADNTTDINNFFDTSVKEDNFSEILAYSAIGIWVIDLIWTIAGSSKLKKELNNLNAKAISISADYEPFVSVPMISLKYKF